MANYQHFDPNGVGLLNGHFIGLPFTQADAQLVLLSIPWDVTVSYGAGTSTGSQNILEASPQLDLYDPFLPDAWKKGLYLIPNDPLLFAKNQRLRPLAKQYIDFLEEGGHLEDSAEMQQVLAELNEACAQMKDWVFDRTAALLDAGKLVGLVGGDHSTPLGFMEQLAQRYERFGILQIDAHADLRQAYEGFTYSHASIFYNSLTIPNLTALVQVGIRDYCDAEAQLAEAEDRIHLHTEASIRKALFSGRSLPDLVDELLAPLPEQVYISFDIDGLDPTLCPNTGTPVPGGFSFQEAVFLLERLVESGRKIIGFDLSEVAGMGHEWDGNVGARILYKLCNCMARSRAIPNIIE